MTKYCGTTPTAELNTLVKGLNLCPSLPTRSRRTRRERRGFKENEQGKSTIDETSQAQALRL